MSAALAACGDNKEVHEVWAWNLDCEFSALLAAARASGEAGGAIVALDMEFPGFLRQQPRSGAPSACYQALRENVDRLRPIQLGAAVAGADGVLRGVWSFNLHFDVDVDLHTEKSVAFLRAAGIDFPRHASEGIEAATLGRWLASSVLVGKNGFAPWWVTFSGSYDLGYLLKLLTSGRPLPRDFGAFDVALSFFCPRRHELRDQLPHGSLESLAREHGLQRHGSAHTAGSDALLTLELFLRVVGTKGRGALATRCEAGDAAATCWREAGALAGPRWSPWVVEESWDNPGGWYQNWDQMGWDSIRWDNNVWGFAFPGPAPNVPWLPAVPLGLGVAGMTAAAAAPPIPSAAIWGTTAMLQSATSTAMKASPATAFMDSHAARKMAWWLPDTFKVMEI